IRINFPVNVTMNLNKRAKELAELFIEPTDTKILARVDQITGQNIYNVQIPKSSINDASLLEELGSNPFISTKDTESNNPEADTAPNEQKTLFVKTLVYLPPKFRKIIWVKCGNYILVDLTLSRSEKVSGEIIQVLLPENVKKLKALNKWPEEFEIFNELGANSNNLENKDSDSNDDDLFVNHNRRVYYSDDSDSEDSADSEDENE
ncbi:hypothetical protein BB560_004395, partial [Smittium megazygosporum]